MPLYVRGWCRCGVIYNQEAASSELCKTLSILKINPAGQGEPMPQFIPTLFVLVG